MSAQFDAYEYIAVIAPGSVLTFGGLLVFPELQPYFSNDGLTVGGLGLFVILSFIAGHLLQAGGNLVEWFLWKPFGGMPTNWVLKDNQNLLDRVQVDKLFSKVKAIHPDIVVAEDNKKGWFGVTREIYGYVKDAGKSERVDSFNRSYGLMRGLSTSLITVTLIAAMFGLSWGVIALLVLASATALYRTYRFGVHYGRELFVRYLSL